MLEEARQRLVQGLRKRGVSAYEGASKYTVFAYNAESEFTLSFMPGNSRTVISHAVKVATEHQGKGIGTKLCMLREYAAREAGVTLMLATVRDDNVAEIRVLEKCNWHRLTTNPTTKCSLWGKQLL